MAERSVRVRLQAVVSDFKRAMGEAAESTGRVGESAAKAEQQATGLSKAATAVGTTVKAAALAGTGAVAALGVSTLRTGLAYNQLEQNSRAALTTLLGSSEAAHAQMDELAEFVKTALFPREVFIQAQQQLLAFGFAAEDVIPALSAIQDAVAATGGSAQDFQEVATILAQVQSTGKITAETLNQLGYRGINAAKLIGDAMGQTEGQIRDSITAGTLDGREALQTLVDAMSTEFAGAAALISNTWQGASGLVAAAMRDIGSSLAEPFISKKGGGAAIDWAVSLSELLYAVQGQIDPLVDSMVQRAGPAFENVTELIESATEAVEGADFDGFLDTIEDLSPALIGLGAAGATAGAGMLPFLDRFLDGMRPSVVGMTAFVLTAPEMRDLLKQLFEALAPLAPPLIQLGTILTGMLSQGLAATADLLTPLVELVADAVGWFVQLPGPVQAVAAALTGMTLLRGPLGGMSQTLSGLFDPMRRFGEQMQVQTRLAEMNGIQISKLGAAQATLKTNTGGLLTLLGGPWGLVLGGASVALGFLAQKHMEAKEAARQQEAFEAELGDTLDETTGAVTQRTKELLAAEASEKGYLDLAEQLGIANGAITDAALGNASAQRQVAEAIEEAQDAAAIDTWREFQGAFEEVGITQEDVRLAVLGNAEAWDRVTGAMNGNPTLQGKVQEALQGVSGDTSELTGWIDDNAAAIERQGDQLRSTTEETEGTATATQELGDKVSTTQIDVDALTQSLKELFETHWGAEEAADAQRTTLNNLSEEIKRTNERANEADSTTEHFSTSLKGNSQAAVDNRETLRRLVQQTSDMITEDAKSGIGKDKLREKAAQYKKQLEKELTQLGYNEEEVKEYTNVLDEVPEQVKTETTVTGHKTAVGRIRAVQEAIKALSDKEISITASGYLKSEGGGTVQVYPGSTPFATGGYVSGPGTGTSDDIPAWLSNGEYVVKADAVAKYGKSMLDMVNAGKFAKGGIVGNSVDVNAKTRLAPSGFSGFGEHVAAMMTGSLKKAVSQLAKEIGPSLGGGRVLPAGSYRIGMPYLGYPGHYGADYPAPVGTPVHAVAAGRVSRAARMATSYGIHAFLDHAAGRQSRYAHLSELLVSIGERVAQGQKIGEVGSTGNSTGPHLHYEDRINGSPRNPASLGIFDQGGRLAPGMLGFNGTSKPETVLTPRESAKFDELVASLTSMRAAPQPIVHAGAGAGYREGDFNLTLVSPMDEQAAVIERRQRYRQQARRMVRS